jgi:hypothetical protein
MMNQRRVDIARGVLLGLLLTALLSGSIMAEEILKKGRARFLGQRISDTEFRTCSGQIISISDGEIYATRRKCPPNQEPIPMPTPTPAPKPTPPVSSL